MRTIASLALAGALLLTACGSDDDEPAATDAPATEAPATDAPSTEPPATEPPATEPPATEAPATDPPATEPPATEAPATDPPAAAGVPVSLVEWDIVTPDQIEAGTVTFEVSNDGDFPHEFGITRGTTYEELPLLDNGAIDEDTLGDDVLGRTERLDSGATTTIEFELEPGTYVFFCNIVAGPNSHAANGQAVSVTVGG